MPWGVLILLGGGFTLSFGCTKSGLSKWIAQKLIYFKDWTPLSINFTVSCFAAFMTEFVSNTATANILAPILKQLSLTVCYNPVYLGKLCTVWKNKEFTITEKIFREINYVFCLFVYSCDHNHNVFLRIYATCGNST